MMHRNNSDQKPNDSVSKLLHSAVMRLASREYFLSRFKTPVWEGAASLGAKTKPRDSPHDHKSFLAVKKGREVYNTPLLYMTMKWNMSICMKFTRIFLEFISSKTNVSFQEANR
ncbi:hypothetical protein BaRGS_00031538 [Batillaria attramentaria]|uniref:Uncharacterized protein n=1 Tax=Batillaria attramentaria TaxID=370345 RepID=A0ABD0JRR4_9CAEN